MNLRYATAEDFLKLDGATPKRTGRAIAAVSDDGEVIGIGGVYPDQTRYVMFSNLGEKLKANKRDLLKAIKGMRDLVKDLPYMPIIAEADPEICGSETLLKHLGFHHVFGRIWQCHSIL